MPFLMLNWRWIVAAVLVVLAIGTNISAYRAGSASTQAKWDADKLEQAKQTEKIVGDALVKERELQEAAEKIRRAKNVQINQLATDLADALDRLRNRPSRGSEGSVPPDAGVGRGCYPSQLFTEDAGNLIKLAGEADKLRLSLAACQAQYAKARDALK
jgi:hypothetical protein